MIKIVSAEAYLWKPLHVHHKRAQKARGRRKREVCVDYAVTMQSIATSHVLRASVGILRVFACACRRGLRVGKARAASSERGKGIAYTEP